MTGYLPDGALATLRQVERLHEALSLNVHRTARQKLKSTGSLRGATNINIS